ncbi:hypothetical protein MANES_12G157750v8 [Manihot esculenta]|uniref:Uncharacterized protein n=1 Tax=Manihot esculenta TaxID=3983 RepID=A0ACB7GST1_MANES|nr:hypothetical protein MANES_12G157750v8 [Manihot esculenta]
MLEDRSLGVLKLFQIVFVVVPLVKHCHVGCT